MKLNKTFKQAHKTDKRYRVLYGGAGSGKSFFVGQETILNMLSNKEYSYLVIRKTSRSIKHSVFQLLKDIIMQNDLSKYFNINKSDMTIQCANGSKLITSGLDDAEKLKSIAGVNRIWVEEANEITEQDFNQLDLRLRGKNDIGYQMTLTFNPVSELHWLKKVFFDVGTEDSFILKTTYKDNHHLDDKYVDTLERLKEQDFQYYKIYALGEWGSIGNLVFTNWAKEEFDLSICDNIFNGIDFGFADDPTAFIRVHYDSKRKVIYILDEFYERGMFIDEVAGELKQIIGNEQITCDSSEPRSIADLKRNGLRATGAKKGPGSVEHGIKWLQGHKIIVNPSCINLIKELTAYKWREDKDGNIIPKPVDANNHLIDALRYALESEMVNKEKWGW